MTDHDTPKAFQDKHFKGMTAEQYAEWLEQNANEETWGPPVEAEISKNLSSVVSVRFNKGELAVIVAAAERAGVRPSTFIREVVLSQVTKPEEAQKTAEVLVEHRDEIEKAINVVWNFAKRASHLKDVWGGLAKEPESSATRTKKVRSKRASGGRKAHRTRDTSS